MDANRTTLSGWLTLIAFVGLAATNVVANLVLGNEVTPFLVIFALVLVGVGALTLTRRWWAYVVAALVAALLFQQTLVGAGSVVTDPQTPGFAGAIAFLVLSFVGAVAGVVAALRARRGGAAT